MAKILSDIQASSFVTSVINKYSSLHGLPIVGSGITLPQTPERIANRLSQQTYRNSHARTVIWHSPEKQAIIDAFMEKLLILKNAKSDYKRSLSQLASANSLLTFKINNQPDLSQIQDNITRQAVINAYNNEVQGMRALVASKQSQLNVDTQAYNDAQIP